MLKDDITKIARARLKDAEVLFKEGRCDGAVYICGYAVELGLKRQICKRLNWSKYPPNSEDYKSFKTHNLDILLTLTGKEDKIKDQYFAEWSIVAQWDPESRYNPIGEITEHDTQLMIDATKILLRQL
ncbi:HEPN domain-containing protein [Candidatus Falkowbacteria bacterium]|nr:HEPN domain-containing protein [Candidatus Falkowbacteria bacterium]